MAQFVGESNLLEAEVIARVAEDRIRVRLEGLELTLRCRQSVGSGATVHVLVRPEDLRVALPGDASAYETRLAGVIIDKTYKGDTLDTLIRLDSGKTLLASSSTRMIRLSTTPWVSG